MATFVFGEDEYDYDGKLSVEDAMMLFEKTNGLGVQEMGMALDRGNPFAIAAWWYLLKRRAGEAVQWKDILKLNVNEYRGVKPEDPTYPADDPDGEAENPTEPNSESGATPEPDTDATT